MSLYYTIPSLPNNCEECKKIYDAKTSSIWTGFEKCPYNHSSEIVTIAYNPPRNNPYYTFDYGCRYTNLFMSERAQKLDWKFQQEYLKAIVEASYQDRLRNSLQKLYKENVMFQWSYQPLLCDLSPRGKETKVREEGSAQRSVKWFCHHSGEKLSKRKTSKQYLKVHNYEGTLKTIN
jgi:hypothetical protein